MCIRKGACKTSHEPISSCSFVKTSISDPSFPPALRETYQRRVTNWTSTHVALHHARFLALFACSTRHDLQCVYHRQRRTFFFEGQILMSNDKRQNTRADNFIHLFSARSVCLNGSNFKRAHKIHVPLF